MDRETYDFTNKVFAFVDSDQLQTAVETLEHFGVKRNLMEFLDLKERREFIHNLEHSSNPITRLRFIADKVIGSGPAEFARDLKNSPVNETLICIEIEKASIKDSVFEALRSVNAQRIKYFHPMYTEHGTLENNHRQEIQPVN